MFSVTGQYSNANLECILFICKNCCGSSDCCVSVIKPLSISAPLEDFPARGEEFKIFLNDLIRNQTVAHLHKDQADCRHLSFFILSYCLFLLDAALPLVEPYPFPASSRLPFLSPSNWPWRGRSTILKKEATQIACWPCDPREENNVSRLRDKCSEQRSEDREDNLSESWIDCSDRWLLPVSCCRGFKGAMAWTYSGLLF